jgi:hypothetical protein
MQNIKNMKISEIKRILMEKLNSETDSQVKKLMRLKQYTNLTKDEAIYSIAEYIKTGNHVTNHAPQLFNVNDSPCISKNGGPLTKLGAIFFQLLVNSISAANNAATTGNGFSFEFKQVMSITGLCEEDSGIDYINNLRTKIQDGDYIKGKLDNNFRSSLVTINEIESAVDTTGINGITNIIANKLSDNLVNSIEAFDLINIHAKLNKGDVRDYIAQVDNREARATLNKESRYKHAKNDLNNRFSNESSGLEFS